MTSEHSQQSLFNLTQYAEGSHVNQSAQQAKEKASQKLQNLVCGLNSSEPYAWYDQNTSSWKTYQRSLITDWTSFSETFTRQGMMRSGVVYQAALLEPATKEIDGGLLDSLPTPTTMDHLGQRSPEALKRQMEGPRKGRTKLANLREAVNPKTQQLFNSMLPTPTATDYKGRSGQGYIERHGEHRISDVLTQVGDNMNLNPAFVEEMMGYPIGWTDLKH